MPWFITNSCYIRFIFRAEYSTDKDMTNLSKKYDQMNNNLDILDSQDISLKKQLEKDAAAFREEKFRHRYGKTGRVLCVPCCHPAFERAQDMFPTTERWAGAL